MMAKRSGFLQYTQRGFAMDAEDAMRGDVFRALIELITNADDAYNAKGGPIDVVIEQVTGEYEFKISVHDKATGLDADAMEKAFTHLGDVNKKFIGDQGTRGLFGRGAKDVAVLGKAEFNTICKNKYSSLEIFSNGEYEFEHEDEEVTEDFLSLTRLNAGQSGLTSTLYVASRIKVPSAQKMVDKLQKHVQIRDLLNRNEVIIYDSRSKTPSKLNGLAPSGNQLMNKSLSIPGYKFPVNLEVYELPTKEIGTVNEYSKQGLIVSGKGAAYENSFLHMSNAPEAGWFCGRIEAPEIHDLAKSIDQDGGKNELNPTRIVSRQRDGLVEQHPYYRALCSAIEKELKPIFQAKADLEGAQRKEGSELRNKFDSIAAQLAKTLQDIMDADELGEIPTSTSIGEEELLLSIIPPKRIIKQGDTVTFTVRSPDNIEKNRIVFEIESGSDTIEILKNESENFKWIKHPRLNAFDTTLRVKANKVGSAILIAYSNEQKAKCEIFVIDYDQPIPPVPLELQFENSEYSVSLGKVKKMVIQAPLTFYGEDLKILTVDKLVALSKHSNFKAHSSGLFVESIIYAKASDEKGSVDIVVNVGGQDAKTRLTIKESSQKKYPNLKLELDGRDNPPRRVDTLRESGQLVVRIYGVHKSLKGVLGPYQSDHFKFENTPQASATIGEIIAQQLATYVVEREAEAHPDRFTDAAMYFFRQQQLITSFVTALQTGLILDNG
jgi:hypothetical protein